MSVRTRFAPSPTGYLHVGGARTALFCWLYAKRHQGQFILRVEDTDRERSTEESVQAILEGMAWLGLDYDEGPFYQTQRFDRYQQVLQQWLEQGHAYRCYCSKEHLQQLREAQIARKEKPRYDQTCRQHNYPHRDEPYVIRFNNPVTGDVVIDDLVLGQVVFSNKELDDLIIARSDGTPTYNFTVVVDDWDMQVSHVIRGNDHINNTPRQINMLKALGATVPQYAHVPMILGSDGKRLSKRHGAVSVLQFREEGFLPQALLNYLVRLGWSHGDQEIFSLEEMVQLFDIEAVNKSAATFDPEKLRWLNQHYLKTLPLEEVSEQLKWHLAQDSVDLSEGPDLLDVVAALRERVKTLQEMAQKAAIFYQPLTGYDEVAAAKFLTAETVSPLQAMQQGLVELTTWEQESINAVVKQVLASHELKMPKLAQPLRVAVTGNTISPSIDVTLFLMGRDKVLDRIAAAIDYCGS